mmetsp:Transcript_93721/g.292051  ORF Transcript_93721/g.292051 Transcript_93721/m.292051 type:complete len:255 (+) Transcript_93721:68-832(+)
MHAVKDRTARARHLARWGTKQGPRSASLALLREVRALGRILSRLHSYAVGSTPPAPTVRLRHHCWQAPMQRSLQEQAGPRQNSTTKTARLPLVTRPTEWGLCAGKTSKSPCSKVCPVCTGSLPSLVIELIIWPPSKSHVALSITSAVKREPKSLWLAHTLRPSTLPYSWNSMVRGCMLPSAQCERETSDSSELETAPAPSPPLETFRRRARTPLTPSRSCTAFSPHSSASSCHTRRWMRSMMGSNRGSRPLCWR